MKNSAPVTRMGQFLLNTPPKTNIDTQNDGLEKRWLTPFFLIMALYLGYLYVKISGWLRDPTSKSRATGP